MFQFECVMALALITSPVDTPIPSGVAQRFEKLRPVLQGVAVQWEILDPREVRYILARPEDFVSDLNLVRRRYQTLADAPALSDCQRFPDRDAVNELLSFNRAYRQHLAYVSRWSWPAGGTCGPPCRRPIISIRFGTTSATLAANIIM